MGYSKARDGEEFTVRSNGGDWLIAWFPPDATPDGIAHGANAFCMTADDHVVLINLPTELQFSLLSEEGKVFEEELKSYVIGRLG